MPGSSSTSFIPKRNPARKERQGVKRKIFFGSFIIRILFFAVLLSAAGVYFYKKSLKSELDSQVVAFNSAIAEFNVPKMEEVLAMDLRLAQANDRLAHSASIVSLLKSFEDSTVQTSQVRKFSLNRTNDASFEVEADIKTSSFDSVMFQRSAYENSSTLAVTEIDDLILSNVPPQSALYEGVAGTEEGVMSVAFTAVLSVNPDNIHHLPRPVSQDYAPITPVVTEPVSVSTSTESAAVEETEVNENVI